MKIKKNLFVICFLFCISPLFSQQLPNEIVETFFEKYEKEGASKSLDYVYSTNSWVNRSADDIITLKNQLSGLNEDFVGKYYGYEKLVEKKVGESFLLVSYLVKYDRQPIRFTFQFYKPDAQWKLFSFKFDGALDEEIEEAAKLYRQNLNK